MQRKFGNMPEDVIQVFAAALFHQYLFCSNQQIFQHSKAEACISAMLYLADNRLAYMYAQSHGKYFLIPADAYLVQVLAYSC